MADKVFGKNNFYDRPWSSLFHAGFQRNLRRECPNPRAIAPLCMQFREYFSVLVAYELPSSVLLQLHAVESDVERERNFGVSDDVE